MASHWHTISLVQYFIIFLGLSLTNPLLDFLLESNTAHNRPFRSTTNPRLIFKLNHQRSIFDPFSTISLSQLETCHFIFLETKHFINHVSSLTDAKPIEPLQIIRDLGVRTMKLMTNNPSKYVGLKGYGLSVVGRVPLLTPITMENQRYMETKRSKMGHLYGPQVHEILNGGGQRQVDPISASD